VDEIRDDPTRMTISRTITRLVLEQKKAILIEDTATEPSVESGRSLQGMKIRSTMCTPLITADGRIAGLLSLDAKGVIPFVRDDLDVLEAVGRQAALALQNAALHRELLRMGELRRSLELGRSIVDLLLPESVPTPPGYRFWAHYRAAHMVGGDFYDFIPLEGDRLAILVGDVAGKGIPAALLMSRLSGECRAAVFSYPEPAEALAQLNSLMCRSRFDGTFVTLTLNVLDLPSGRLACGSAGHDSILVRRAGGVVEACDDSIRGCVLGCDPGATYRQAAMDLAPGDVVSIFTDGVTDACNPQGQRYDSILCRRLVPRMKQVVGGPEEMGRALLHDVDAFVSGHAQADDITLVCFGPQGA
jgi:serine phosphatase RsbU (regulator of sigma subunit)